MKIYFAGSIRAGRDDVGFYTEIIRCLKKHGQVLTEHIGHKKLGVAGEKNLTDKKIHRRDWNWVLASDVVVAEVTTPSLGIGYEIGRAVEHKKKIFCLYRQQKNKRLSAMIAGCPTIIVKVYKRKEELEKIIDELFALIRFKPSGLN
jgi:2'-deoxynucleoside 5'-phosphate N-hydrolase